MASHRICSLVVFASNGIIRTLFLPACHVLLLSPFILVIAHYFGLDQTLWQQLPKDFHLLSFLTCLVLSSVLVLLPTRLFSAFKHGGTKSKGEPRTRRVQSLPYWIPGVKHFWSIFLGGESWIEHVRDSSVTGIASYDAAGAKHHIIFDDWLLEQVDKNRERLKEVQTYEWALLRNAFAIPKNAQKRYFELLPQITRLLEMELFQGDQMQNVVESSLNILSESLPDLITFNSSLVDQMQWERVSNVELTDGTLEVECDLFTLVNEFCCNVILPPIVGTQFTESYQLLATDLAAMNQRFWALALGLPRLFPVQGLPTAALAQKRLIYNIKNFLHDLTNPRSKDVPDDESVSGDEEMDADAPTPLTRWNALFTKHGLSMEMRASLTLRLVHGIVAEVVPLVFWTLLHIFSSSTPQDNEKTDDSPLRRIKAETKAWAQAVQPPSIHPSFPAPPEIRFKSTSEAVSLENFPHLRSCIHESRRLYCSSNTVYEVAKPFTLETKDIAPASERDYWELDAGSYIDVGLSRNLTNLSPANHISPSSFQPDRFVSPSGFSSTPPLQHPSTSYTNALLLSILAGMVQLWELSPAPKKTLFDHMREIQEEAAISAAPPSVDDEAGKEQANKKKQKEKDMEQKKKREKAKWVAPGAVDGAEVKLPKANIRVRIRRLEGLPKVDVVRRIG